MPTVEESIEVEVPVSVAYNQWTQFEEFPKFMEGVEAVRQLDDTHLHWVAEIAGERPTARTTPVRSASRRWTTTGLVSTSRCRMRPKASRSSSGARSAQTTGA